MIRPLGFASNLSRIALLTCLIISSACGSGSEPDAQSASPVTAGDAQGAKPAAAMPPTPPVDGCTLLSRADVETLTGASAQDGQKEQLDNLTTCSFGDPTAPAVGGRALSQVLVLSVMTGQEGAYFAGPVAQARDSFEMARKNAASAEPVNGLGDVAYWDKVLSKLSVVSGRYLIDVEVASGANALTTARSAADKALSRLPR